MMKSYDFKVGDQSFTARIVEYTETKVVVELNGNTYDVELSSATPISTPMPSSRPVPAAPTAAPAPAPVTPAPATQAPAATGSGAVKAPIPGVVRQINVAVGDAVTEGTIVLLLEAMKMENQITAAVTGTVTSIPTAVGDSVQEGQVLMQIEAS